MRQVGEVSEATTSEAMMIDKPSCGCFGNLSEFMGHFNISYTGYFNRRHNRVGHLYQGRYKSILVDKDAYMSALSRYLHLNSARIGAFRNYTDEQKSRASLPVSLEQPPGVS